MNKLHPLVINYVYICIFLIASGFSFIHAQISPETKWLGTTSSQVKSVDHFLKNLKGSMRLMVCHYDAEYLNQLEVFTSNKLQANNALWEVNTKTHQLAEDGMAISVDFELKKGNETNAGIGIAFDFKKWDFKNYVLIPAAVYNGNRMRIVNSNYGEGLDKSDLYNKHLPLTSKPIPHLAFKKVDLSKLELNASNTSTPAMCFFDPKKQLGFIVLTTQNTIFGDNGFNIQESVNKTEATFVITAPGVREKRPLFVGFTKSDDRGASISEGTKISMNLQVYVFKAKGISDVLNKFLEVRKAVTGENVPRKLIPFSAIENYMTQRIDARYYQDKNNKAVQFYCPENAHWISFGWVGGLMNTFPMLALNDSLHLKRVINTFNFAIPKGQGTSGYFYGALNYTGIPFGREGYDFNPKIVLTRKNADVLYWMLKQFELLKVQGKANAINPTWEIQIKKLADAFVNTWKNNKQWGNFVENDTGNIAVYNTSSGVMAIAGLALASTYYKQSNYLKIAEEAANYYYNLFKNEGMTTGGCADILQNADAETAAGLTTALMTLYEITHNKTWLDKSKTLASLVATWTTSYNYELPKSTELAQNGARLAGAYWASTQNKHSAPGICTSSGNVLFKLYRAFNNPLYADLLYDIVGAYGESVRPDGYTNERLTYCDAEPESVGNRGQHITGWNELNGFLMALEIPGIYIQTDSDNYYVFDAVNVSVEKTATGKILNITNPTPFPANISIFAETQAQANQPIAETEFIKWPKVLVKSGATNRYLLSHSGTITPL